MKIFKFCIFTLVLVFCAASIPAQSWTPNGKPFSPEFIFEYRSPFSLAELDYFNYLTTQNYPSVEVLQAPRVDQIYNCHFFAWHINQGYGIWDKDYVWKNGIPDEIFYLSYPDDFYTDGEYSVPAGFPSYVETTASDAEIGVYKYNNQIIHAARFLQGSDKVISKWGFLGVYKHDPDDIPANYGTITNYYKINPDFRPVNDPGKRNMSISDALEGAPEGSLVSVYPGVYNTGSIDIPVDINLYVQDGVVLNFDFFSGLRVYGSIEAYGTVFKSNTNFESVGPGDWKGIELYNDGIIENSTIKNAVHGILTSNCDNVVLRANTVTNSSFGIYSINGGFPLISGNDLSYIQNSAISTFATPALITLNTIRSSKNQLGIFVSGDPAPIEISKNDISDVGYGIYLSNVSYALLEDNSITNYQYARVRTDPNSLIDNNTEGLFSLENSGKNNNSRYFSVPAGAISKTGENTEVNPDAEQLYNQGVDLFANEQYEQALDVFKLLIIEHTDSKFARKSLRYVTQALKALEKSTFNAVDYFDYIKQAIAEILPNNDLIEIIDLHNLYWLLQNERYLDTEEKYDDLITGSVNAFSINDLLYGKALFYIYEIGRRDNGISILEKLLDTVTEFSGFARVELGNLTSFLEYDNTISRSTNYLRGNYPNPFNANTMIKFVLNSAVRVKIAVYNSAGQEITVLLSQDLPAGLYRLNWDGRNQAGIPVSSGVYFYRMTAGTRVESRKMLLVK